MDLIPIITTLISIAATAIVGVILKNQIDSQKQTITDLNDYIKTTNWKEVQSYYDNFKLPAEKDITRHSTIKEYGFTKEQYDEQLKAYNELVDYFYVVLKNFSTFDPNLKSKLENSIPMNAKYFRDIWQDDLQQTHDLENNQPLK